MYTLGTAGSKLITSQSVQSVGRGHVKNLDSCIISSSKIKSAEGLITFASQLPMGTFLIIT